MKIKFMKLKQDKKICSDCCYKKFCSACINFTIWLYRERKLPGRLLKISLAVYFLSVALSKVPLSAFVYRYEDFSIPFIEEMICLCFFFLIAGT